MNLGQLNNAPHTGHFGPPAGSAQIGQTCAEWIDHRLLGLPQPNSMPKRSMLNWLDRVFEHGGNRQRGFHLASIPPEWLPAIRRASVPLVLDGGWMWSDTVVVDQQLTAPALHGDRLALPPADHLLSNNGVELKPIRRWLAERLGVRLQAAPGIRMTAWANQVVLVSTRDEPLGGFLHGPGPEQRQAMSWKPGQALWVKFDAVAAPAV